jgi:hypothetical protein
MDDFTLSDVIYKEEVDYHATFLDGEEHVCFHLLMAPYEGIHLTFGEISFGDEDLEGNAHLNFTYTLVRTEGYEEDFLYESKEFKQVVCDLLYSVIVRQIVEREKLGSSRDNHPQKSSD